MMRAVRQAIVSLGVPDEQILTEEFISPRSVLGLKGESTSPLSSDSDLAAGETASITFALSKQQVEVEASSTILEAAEQAGVALAWECRSGICGQCKVRCTSGRVRMDSRDALTQAEEAKGFILACQSHPVEQSLVIEA